MVMHCCSRLVERARDIYTVLVQVQEGVSSRLCRRVFNEQVR